MAIVRVSKNIPPRMDPLRMARNGMVATAGTWCHLARSSNTLLAHRRRLLASAVRSFDQWPSGSTPVGSLVDFGWARFRTGPGSSVKIYVQVLTLAKHSALSSANPGRLDCELFSDSAVLIETKTVYRQDRVQSSTEIMPELGLTTFIFSSGVAAKTWFQMRLRTQDDMQVISWCAWDVSADALDTADDGVVDPDAVADRSVVLASQQEDLIKAINRQLRSGGAGCLASFTHTTPSASVSTTSASYICPIDNSTTSGTMDANDPIWTIDTRYRALRGESTVRCRFNVLANTSSGSAGEVGLYDISDSSAPKVAVTGITNSATWRSQTVDLTEKDGQYLLMFRNTGGATTFLYAASLDLIDERS